MAFDLLPHMGYENWTARRISDHKNYYISNVVFYLQTMWNVFQGKNCQDGTSQISCTLL
jgi:hypothetical protein